MSDKLKIRVIKEIDFEDLEEAIDDGRKYVKLKSRDEPYEVDEDTYEKILAWIAKVNVEREELKPCPWCGTVPHFMMIFDEGDEKKWYSVACDTLRCFGSESRLYYSNRKDAAIAWNRRAE